MVIMVMVMIMVQMVTRKRRMVGMMMIIVCSQR